jgi:DNA-binding CsgD family transcriptional regulator
MIEGVATVRVGPGAPQRPTLALVPARPAPELRSFEGPGETARTLAFARQGVALLVAALDSLGLAAFVCDGEARVQALTAAGESALAIGRMRLVKGRLAPPRRHDPMALQAAVAEAAATGAGPVARVVVSRDPWEPAAVHVAEVIALEGREHPVLVVLHGARAYGAGLEAVLTGAFGLTPAEAEVASGLAGGEPRAAIAARRGASLQTVRSQIKAVFAKLGVTRERELLALLVRIGRL